jgi:hypothetical protein
MWAAPTNSAPPMRVAKYVGSQANLAAAAYRNLLSPWSGFSKAALSVLANIMGFGRHP